MHQKRSRLCRRERAGGIGPDLVPPASSPLCCERNEHLAFGFPAVYLPILFTLSTSRTGGFAIEKRNLPALTGTCHL